MKNKIITFSFSAVIFGLFILNLFRPSQEISFSERRKLAQMPQISYGSLMDGKFMQDFDKYASDQFIWRESFRSIKSYTDKLLFRKLDTNGLFQIGDDIFKIEYPLNETKVFELCGKLNRVYDMYLSGMNVSFSVIPDKNCYIPENSPYPVMDYRKIEEIMQENLSSMKYISLFDKLSLDSYYNTDGHWRQEKLKSAAEALCEGMGVSFILDTDSFEMKTYEPFYGAYYGQSARKLKADRIVWMVNKDTENAEVLSISFPDRTDLKVYNEEGLVGIDSYDLFLYGAQPLIKLKNKNSSHGRSLIIFRDSYSSSLAPLLLGCYDEIILIDLRYISPELIGEYVDFSGQDILFLLSTTIINNSDIIR